MKKIQLAAALIAVLCGAAGSESWTSLFSMRAWGRAVIAPYAFSGDDSSVSAATYSSGMVPAIGFKVAGTAPEKKIGFNLDLGYGYIIDGNQNTFGNIFIGDDAKLWTRPFDFVTLSAGWFIGDDLRGKIGNTMFSSWLLPNGGKSEDAIFTRFKAVKGAFLKIEPFAYLERQTGSLYIEGAIGSNLSVEGANNGESLACRNLIDLDAADVYRRMQAGIGYWWPGIGFLRAQFIGNNRDQLEPDYQNNGNYNGQYLTYGLSTSGDADVLEAAVMLSCIDTVDLDLGVKFPLKYTTDTGFTEYPALKPNAAVVTVDGDERIVQKPFGVSVATNWMPNFLLPFYLSARVDATFGGSVEETGHHKILFGSDIAAWFLPSYQVLEKLRVGIDFGMEIKQKDQWQQPIGKEVTSKTEGSDYVDFGAGAWVELEIEGGKIRAGAMVMVPGSDRWTWVSGNSTNYEFRQVFSGEPVVSFPISVTYSF